MKMNSYNSGNNKTLKLLGLYVAITSVDPLRVYIYDNVLLRLCKKPYPIVLNEHSDVESYVVVDYLPPWAPMEMKEIYTELPSSSHPGTNHWYALKTYLERKGYDGLEFERSVYSMITVGLYYDNDSTITY